MTIPQSLFCRTSAARSKPFPSGSPTSRTIAAGVRPPVNSLRISCAEAALVTAKPLNSRKSPRSWRSLGSSSTIRMRLTRQLSPTPVAAQLARRAGSEWLLWCHLLLVHGETTHRCDVSGSVEPNKSQGPSPERSSSSKRGRSGSRSSRVHFQECRFPDQDPRLQDRHAPPSRQLQPSNGRASISSHYQ